MDLSRFFRTPLACLPTPIEPLSRLSSFLGGPPLFVKRDDETGLGLGGNKLRKLEFLLGEAMAEGADTVLTVGALQSNHARQTAAACARLGLDCELILRPGALATESYLNNGNVLLDRLFGARLIVVDAGASREQAMAERATALCAAGRRPYCIPVGGSNARGNLGYALCAAEILAQARQLGISFAGIVLATGSGGTQAGLLAGLHALEASLPVTGIAVEGTQREQEALVHEQSAATLALLDEPHPLSRERIRVVDSQVGPGYARPTDSMREALSLAARFEGLVLDPVYTGKAFAGLVALVRDGRCGKDQPLLFLHTGGTAGLFAYPESV